MTRPLFSSSWHRVAPLAPRLSGHARIQRQQYRGETWYVLEDRVGERFYRFSPQTYLVIGLMDGRRTVQEIWDAACERLGDEAPTQDEVIHLLAQLHAGDALQSGVAPDTAELFERHQKREDRRRLSRLATVFGWRLPLFDPEGLLQRFVPVVRPFVGWGGLVLWLAIVLPAAVLLAVHWRELTENTLDRVLAIESVAALWLLFVLIKTLHEFGHAVVTKAYGGEVHDMGVMLLVFTPVPYVDASSAWAFPEKRRRIAVGAAGMLVELFLAALALYVWLAAEPGTVRTLATNTILLAGISTVLFNANPLLRFDGYYMLADWLEIPNLGPRANHYLGYLCERYLFGRRDAERPLATAGERAWFAVYGIGSFLYRILVLAAIVVFLGAYHPSLAVFFAAVAGTAWIAVPVVRGLAYLFRSTRIRKVRARAVSVTAATLAVIVWFIGFVAVPFRSLAEGVIWIPEESFVRAGTDGFLERVTAIPGTRVRRGDPLLVLHEPAVQVRLIELEARRRELQARYDEQYAVDRVKAQVIQDELGYVRQSLDEARRRLAELTVRARADGVFVVPAPEDLPGRFVKKGELLGYTVELGTVTVRAVIPQTEIDLVRHRTREVHVRLAERLTEAIPGVIRRTVPGASEHLPTTALGREGGGTVPVDPRDARGVTAMEKVFQLDIELQAQSPLLNVGGRAYVRFDHGRAPLAVQWYQQIQQLFLSRFNV